MYIYQISYASYEASPKRYITHELKFEADEFDQLILLAVESLVREWLDSDDEFRVLDRFDNLVPHDIADWLVQNRGFRDIETVAAVHFNGWSGILPGDSSFREDDTPHNKAVLDLLVRTGLDVLVAKKNLEISVRHNQESLEHMTIVCAGCSNLIRMASPQINVCKSCYKDPETNNCTKCGKHLEGVAYEYVCGPCITGSQK